MSNQIKFVLKNGTKAVVYIDKMIVGRFENTYKCLLFKDDKPKFILVQEKYVKNTSGVTLKQYLETKSK
tara:strand:+ start:2340 stop:2546 length:207 start_codon:yes stop_codon:yes gene_type:complete